MSDRIATAEFKPGDKIFAEGERGHLTYIIRKGEVRITQNIDGEERIIAHRKPGDVIGEMAVVSGACRSATATAVSGCVLAVLSRNELDRRLENADPILKVILLTAFERIREAAAKANYHEQPSERVGA